MEESIYFQAKDLMLGDWIKIGNVPLRVIQLTHFTHKDDSVVLETGSEYLDVEPIPLTAKILEKNGFEETDKCCSFKDNYCSISIYIDRIEGDEIDNASIFLEGALFDMHININYVHELQHALKLCGIDKEIVL